MNQIDASPTGTETNHLKEGLAVFKSDQKHLRHPLPAVWGFPRERAVLIFSISLICLCLASAAFGEKSGFLPLLSGLLFAVLLFAGYFSGRMPEGRAIRIQLALWKETRYVAVLSQLLKMEIERHRSVEELWLDYQFVVKKLGFSQVRLLLTNGPHVWESEGYDQAAAQLKKACHELPDGSVIEFAGDPRILPEHLFKLRADLSAQLWRRAIRRWSALDKVLSQSMPAARASDFSSERKFDRCYTTAER